MDAFISPTLNNNTRFETLLRKAIEFPGIRVDRAAFLRRVLSKYFNEATVERAITANPAQAGIDPCALERITKACINRETRRVSLISAATGIKGGVVLFAAIPADTVQFFVHVLRVLQKLAYLYGWQEMFTNGEEDFGDETNNRLTLFIGAMFGVEIANQALNKIAFVAAQNVPGQLLGQILTKATIYPIIRRVAANIGAKMTKAVFAKSIGKIKPVIGAAASGGITYAIFKPMANRLKRYLSSLPTANTTFYTAPPSDIISEVDFSDINISEENIKEAHYA